MLIFIEKINFLTVAFILFYSFLGNDIILFIKFEFLLNSHIYAEF
jgi:hypothetical protein